jgi:hypothetical protein
VAALAHASAAVCQASIIPQLPALAKRSWLDAAPAPDALFDLGAPLPALRWHELALNSRGTDSVTAVLPALYEQCRGELRTVVADLVAALADLKAECAQLAPRDRTLIAGPRSFDLAHRYAVLVAASACLGVWSRRSDFLGDPAWVTAALRRLAERLRGQRPAAVASDPGLHAELIDRFERDLAFDTTREPLYY